MIFALRNNFYNILMVSVFLHRGQFIFNAGCIGGVECVWVRNIFRQICMGTKYFQKFLYGYEIIFTTLVKNLWIALNSGIS